MTASVWEWIYDMVPQLRKSGHEGLAKQVTGLAGWAINGDVAMVESAVPEIVAGAGTLGVPWLEVFARHWELQCRTVYRGEGESVLADCVRAFEKAHRDEMRDCPQALCTTQDLVIAYANADGPGYVVERLEALDESLERVPIRRECFECLSEEKALALLDAARFGEALRVFDTAVQRLKGEGRRPSDYFSLVRPEILLASDDPAAAKQELDRLRRMERSPTRRESVRWSVLRAAALARIGHLEESVGALPKLEEVEPFAREHVMWCHTVRALIEAGRLENTYQLGEEMNRLLAVHERGGAHRRAIDVAGIAAALAAARGACSTAEWTLDRIRFHAHRLRDPADVAADVQSAEALVAAMPAAKAPVSASELPAYLQANQDTPREVALDWIAAAIAEAPNEPELIGMKAESEHVLGRTDAAISTLRQAIRAGSRDVSHAALLTQLLTLARRDAEVQALAAELSESDPVISHWVLALFNAARQRWPAAIAECEQVVALRPDAKNARRVWAAAARELGQWDVAVARLQEVATSDAAEPADQWNLIVAATVLSEWKVVREAAARLGMPISTEGPLDGSFGSCWVLPKDEPPSGQRFFAVRSGPALARIVSVTPPERPQRAGDVVVVDPTPLEPPPEDVTARESWIPLFREVAVRQKASVTAYAIAGPDPGNDSWSVLVRAVRDRGWFIWVLSGDDYQVRLSAKKRVPGIYAALAVPVAEDAGEVSRYLAEVTSAWKDPVAWPDLARASAHDVARHEQMELRYGLRD